MTGLGGDMFAMVKRGESEEIIALNAAGTAPRPVRRRGVACPGP